MWAHVTPHILYAISMMSDLSNFKVSLLIAVDIIIMVSAVVFEFAAG